MTNNLPIQTKLFYSFFLFAGFAFLILLSIIWYLEVKLECTEINEEWQKVYSNVIALEQEQKSFFADELLYRTFYQAGTSKSLKKQQKWKRAAIAGLDQMIDQGRFDAMGIPSAVAEEQVNQVKSALNQYTTDFDAYLRIYLKTNDQSKGISPGLISGEKEAFSTQPVFSGLNLLGSTIKHQIEARTRKMLLFILCAGVLTFVVSIVLAMIFAKKIVQPVLVINEKIDAFITNGLKMKSWDVEVQPKDEVGQLTENFNLMTKQLNKGVSKLHRQIEELSKSNQQLASFASIVSHDLKSPLRTMNSFVNLMRRRMKDKLGESELEYMTYIQDGAQKMTELVNDLHEFSTVNAKGIVVEKVAFEPMLNEVLQLVDYQVKETNAIIRVKSNLRVIKCDLIKIRQVFQNLIGNSMKYVATDVRPEIKITCAELAKSWQFSINDNGIGIPDDYCKQIFQPFNRAGMGQEYEGTGLGLSICKKIVEKHDGQIWVEPNPAGGTTFHFTISKLLPLTKRDVTQSS